MHDLEASTTEGGPSTEEGPRAEVQGRDGLAVACGAAPEGTGVDGAAAETGSVSAWDPDWLLGTEWVCYTGK